MPVKKTRARVAPQKIKEGAKKPRTRKPKEGKPGTNRRPKNATEKTFASPKKPVSRKNTKRKPIKHKKGDRKMTIQLEDMAAVDQQQQVQIDANATALINQSKTQRATNDVVESHENRILSIEEKVNIVHAHHQKTEAERLAKEKADEEERVRRKADWEAQAPIRAQQEKIDQEKLKQQREREENSAKIQAELLEEMKKNTASRERLVAVKEKLAAIAKETTPPIAAVAPPAEQGKKS